MSAWLRGGQVSPWGWIEWPGSEVFIDVRPGRPARITVEVAAMTPDVARRLAADLMRAADVAGQIQYCPDGARCVAARCPADDGLPPDHHLHATIP